MIGNKNRSFANHGSCQSLTDIEHISVLIFACEKKLE